MTLFVSNFQNGVTTELPEDEVTTSTDMLTNSTAGTTTSKTRSQEPKDNHLFFHLDRS